MSNSGEARQNQARGLSKPNFERLTLEFGRGSQYVQQKFMLDRAATTDRLTLRFASGVPR
jgi:hypothetical protein